MLSEVGDQGVSHLFPISNSAITVERQLRCADRHQPAYGRNNPKPAFRAVLENVRRDFVPEIDADGIESSVKQQIDLAPGGQSVLVNPDRQKIFPFHRDPSRPVNRNPVFSRGFGGNCPHWKRCCAKNDLVCGIQKLKFHMIRTFRQIFRFDDNSLILNGKHLIIQNVRIPSYDCTALQVGDTFPGITKFAVNSA